MSQASSPGDTDSDEGGSCCNRSCCCGFVCCCVCLLLFTAGIVGAFLYLKCDTARAVGFKTLTAFSVSSQIADTEPLEVVVLIRAKGQDQFKQFHLPQISMNRVQLDKAADPPPSGIPDADRFESIKDTQVRSVDVSKYFNNATANETEWLCEVRETRMGNPTQPPSNSSSGFLSEVVELEPDSQSVSRQIGPNSTLLHGYPSCAWPWGGDPVYCPYTKDGVMSPAKAGALIRPYSLVSFSLYI